RIQLGVGNVTRLGPESTEPAGVLWPSSIGFGILVAGDDSHHGVPVLDKFSFDGHTHGKLVQKPQEVFNAAPAVELVKEDALLRVVLAVAVEPETGTGGGGP